MIIVGSLQETVLVIGGGLTGIVAAATAIKNGSKVKLVSSGPGTFAMNGGSIRIQSLAPDQPYLKEAIEFFSEMMTTAGCEYMGGLQEKHLIPNILGDFQEVSMAPASIWLSSPVPDSKVMVLGIKGLSGFNPYLIAELLSESAEKRNLQVKYTGKMIEVSWLQNRSFDTLDMANQLADQKKLDKLAEIIRPLAKDYSSLIMPAILDQQTGTIEFNRFAEKVGCTVSELHTIPPSLVGLRIFHHLIKYLQKAGAEINLGYAVQSLYIKDGRCTVAILDTPGRKRVIKADNFILATGRVNRLDYVVYSEGTNDEWKLNADNEVNEKMQLLKQDNLLIAENLYGAGSILENSKKGNAQAILTGYRAGVFATGGK